MAFERLEPFGSLHLEAMFGQVCATLANIHRDPQKRKEPWAPRDFMPALNAALDGIEASSEPVFLDDPEAMTALIKRDIFGVTS